MPTRAKNAFRFFRVWLWRHLRLKMHATGMDTLNFFEGFSGNTPFSRQLGLLTISHLSAEVCSMTFHAKERPPPTVFFSSGYLELLNHELFDLSGDVRRDSNSKLNIIITTVLKQLFGPPVNFPESLVITMKNRRCRDSCLYLLIH